MLFWLLETTCTVCGSQTRKPHISVLLWGRTLHGRSICIHALNYRHYFFFKPPTRHGKIIGSDDIPALQAWLQTKIPSVCPSIRSVSCASIQRLCTTLSLFHVHFTITDLRNPFGATKSIGNLVCSLESMLQVRRIIQ